MPVTHGDPPPGSAEAVQEALRRFAGVPDAHRNALRGTQPAELDPSLPHPVFNLGLSDLTRRAGGGLGAARLTGWRYLLRSQQQVVASAETVSAGGGREEFSHFNQGPFVGGTAAALEAAQAIPETQDRSYELRLLHVPALYAMALWLHADDGGDDVLIPIQPAPPGIEANRPYPAQELLQALAERGRDIPEMGPDDTRGG